MSQLSRHKVKTAVLCNKKWFRKSPIQRIERENQKIKKVNLFAQSDTSVMIQFIVKVKERRTIKVLQSLK